MATPHTYAVHAIVVRRRSLGEADRLLTIFSKEHGKLFVLAKGVRRVPSRRAPYVELFTSVKLFLHKTKTWDIVSDAEPINRFSDVRSDLSSVSLAYYLCEVVDILLPEKQEHRDVYELLEETLVRLSKGNAGDLTRVAVRFSTDLLRYLGYMGRDKQIPTGQIRTYIEHIAERKLRTPAFLTRTLDEDRLRIRQALISKA